MSRRSTFLSLVIACLAAVGVSAAEQHQAAQAHHPAGAMSDEALIKSAMSAAPPAVSKDATIVTVNPEGTIRTVRKGTNNFTCMADNPDTPGPDPMCGDENAMQWFHAYLTKAEPPKGVIGFVYMLEGGTDASNTDPYATKPDANNNWIKTGPHVMVVGARGAMEGYPRDPRPNTAAPYVMWAGTPYEHLMVPVK